MGKSNFLLYVKLLKRFFWQFLVYMNDVSMFISHIAFFLSKTCFIRNNNSIPRFSWALLTLIIKSSLKNTVVIWFIKIWN